MLNGPLPQKTQFAVANLKPLQIPSVSQLPQPVRCLSILCYPTIQPNKRITTLPPVVNIITTTHGGIRGEREKWIGGKRNRKAKDKKKRKEIWNWLGMYQRMLDENFLH